MIDSKAFKLGSLAWVATELNLPKTDVAFVLGIRTAEVGGLADRWLHHPKRRGFDPRGHEFTRWACESLKERAAGRRPRMGLRAARVALAAQVRLDAIDGF